MRSHHFRRVLWELDTKLTQTHNRLDNVANDAAVLEARGHYGVPTNVGGPRRVELVGQSFGEHSTLSI